VPRTVRTIRAIHANAGTEAWYRRELDALVTQAHLEVARIVNEGVPDLVAAAPTGIVLHTLTEQDVFAGRHEQYEITTDAAPPVSKLDKQLKDWARKWNVRFDKLSAEISQKFANKAFRMTEAQMMDALKQAGFTVSFRPTTASLAAYKATAAENVNLIKSIPSQYLTGVQSAVWSSVRAGADMATLSQKLRDEYGLSVKRAATIARDQNNKAKATIETTRRLELGITHAIWQHSSGGKEPRPVHVAMDGVAFELKKGMYDKNERRYVLPGELVNCRCTSRAIIPGFNDDEV
jgi:uncharacterized protein with gpF-like domain